LVSGIDAGRAESSCTAPRAPFAGIQKPEAFCKLRFCSGRFGGKLGGRFSKNRFVVSRRSEF